MEYGPQALLKAITGNRAPIVHRTVGLLGSKPDLYISRRFYRPQDKDPSLHPHPNGPPAVEPAPGGHRLQERQRRPGRRRRDRHRHSLGGPFTLKKLFARYVLRTTAVIGRLELLLALGRTGKPLATIGKTAPAD
jgi:hypothetical protein